MNRRGAKVKIVIVDAARRNPFERRFRAAAAGLATLDAPAGTLTMYSTSPGKLLADSTSASALFGSELIKQLRVPDVTMEEAFNRTRIAVSRASNGEQIPWVASSLVAEFYLRPPAQSAAAPAAAPGGQAPASPSQSTTAAPSTLPPSGASAAIETARKDMKAGELFTDCEGCPEMVVVPAGAFDMGSPAEYENPPHRVTIAKPFAIGRYEVTFEQWDRCVEENGCKAQPDDRQWGRGNRPVINVSWDDAKAFASWLAQKTGQKYRLPTEAEWEYAARAGTTTPYWWGRELGWQEASCRECGTGLGQQTAPAGSYKANPFGVYDTAGNAAEWVEDCWNENYRNAPKDGSPWTTGQCRLRVLRGGAYDSPAKAIRSTARFRYDSDVRYPANGFRVVRELQ
jgi:formylglycine-generating enzyme required for sulfatase activity